MAVSKVGRTRPKTGGRKAGTPNRATAEVKALAQAHGASAIAELARLATGAQSEQARVSACKELLDRAYGRSPQSLSLSGPDMTVEVRSKQQRDAAVAAALRADT